MFFFSEIIFGCLFLLFLALIHKWIEKFRNGFEHRYFYQWDRDSEGFRLSQIIVSYDIRIYGTIFYLIHVIFDIYFMLLIMQMNVFIIGSILMGKMFGYFIFNVNY